MVNLTEVTKHVIKSCEDLSIAEMITMMMVDWYGDEHLDESISLDDIIGENGFTISTSHDFGSITYVVNDPDILEKAVFYPYMDTCICVEYHSPQYAGFGPLERIWDIDMLRYYGII